MRRKEPPEVVYIERGGDASAKWLFWGACLGAGLALLYAPRSGEETRRVLQRRLWKLRAMTEEKVDELVEQFGPRRRAGDAGLPARVVAHRPIDHPRPARLACRLHPRRRSAQTLIPPASEVSSPPLAPIRDGARTPPGAVSIPRSDSVASAYHRGPCAHS